MPKITYFGHIDPVGTKIGLQLAPVYFEKTPFGIPLTIQASSTGSDIQVECSFPEPFQNQLLHTWFYCIEFAQAAVNLAAFQMGAGITVSLDQFLGPNGQKEPLSHYDPVLPPLCTAFTQTDGYAQCLNLVLKEPRLGVALSDLVRATTSPVITLVNCGRVVEAIRHMIAPGSDRKTAWPMMQTALNLDAAYLKFITDHSVPPRHGNPIPVDDGVKSEVTRRSWTVMDRFLHYRLLGSAPLTPPGFPMLNG